MGVWKGGGGVGGGGGGGVLTYMLAKARWEAFFGFRIGDLRLFGEEGFWQAFIRVVRKDGTTEFLILFHFLYKLSEFFCVDEEDFL